MSYVVLARKWRPQKLAEILGQEHVTQTLTNALSSGRIAQTFMFSGPRGVGKTSAARIMAKALSCEASDAPTPDPCGVCRQCTAIASGSSTDVVEIDAASHTGVDNVREVIVEAVRYLPASARYKVYIIDEVHMLSSSSFNALLKTFEEPPAHAKFILATTDIHKVPVTILSRCQRYDFRLIDSARIQVRLAEILAEEQIEYEPGALATVARLADGSMRDAQSLLEQVLAFASGRRVDAPLVREALGVVDTAMVRTVFDAIFGRQPEPALGVVAEVHRRGLGHARFTGSLVDYARDLVMASILTTPSEAIDRPPDELSALTAQAATQRRETLERLFELLCRIQEDVARSSQPRYVLEIGLAKLAAEPPAVPVVELLQKLRQLEQSIGGSSGHSPQSEPHRPSEAASGRTDAGSKGPLGASARRMSSSAPQPPVHASSGPGPQRGKSSAGPGPGGSRPSGPLGRAGRTDAPKIPSFARGRVHGGASARPASTPAEPSGPSDDPPPPDEPPPWLEDAIPVGSGPEPQPKPSPTKSQIERPVEDRPASAPSASAADASGPRSEPPEARYRRFVEAVARKRPALAATLHQVRPMRFEPHGVHLVCETAFDSDKLAEPHTRTSIASALDGFFGSRVPLEVTRAKAPPKPTEGEAHGPRTLVEADDEARQARIAAKLESARTRPAVKAVMSELGASISRVRVLGEGDGDTGEKS